MDGDFWGEFKSLGGEIGHSDDGVCYVTYRSKIEVVPFSRGAGEVWEETGRAVETVDAWAAINWGANLEEALRKSGIASDPGKEGRACKFTVWGKMGHVLAVANWVGNGSLSGIQLGVGACLGWWWQRRGLEVIRPRRTWGTWAILAERPVRNEVK